MDYLEDIPEDFNPKELPKYGIPENSDWNWNFEQREREEVGLPSPTTLKLRKIPR